MSVQSRRTFVTAGIGSILALGGSLPRGFSQEEPERPPALPGEQVFEFVRIAHRDLAGTREMLEDQPGLLNATWDWGGGDFETALGGASHMGNREVAGYLLDNGARLDLFCAATMDMLDVVRAVIDVYPAAIGWKGPHGIPLLRHAEMGEAAQVLEYLTSKAGA